MDTTQYLSVFIDESRQHLDELYNQLLKLEKHPNEDTVVEAIFRAAHTLKGMAATMGYTDLSNLTHKMENVLDGIRNGTVQINTPMIDLLFEAAEHLESIVNDIENNGEGAQDVSQIMTALEQADQGSTTVSDEPSNEQPIDAGQLPSSLSLELDEFQRSILAESEGRGFVNYEITVYLDTDCLLKAARVFMVFEILENAGDIIKSVPSVSDLEEENFESSFTVLLVSKSFKEEISKRILNVSEIDDAVIVPFEIDQYKDKPADSASHKTKEDAPEKPSEPSTDDRSSSSGNHTPVKKTIRVDIDKLDNLMNLFEELVIDRGRLEQISSDIKRPDLEETVEHMNRIFTDLQNMILNMRMEQIEHVFNRFPRMVRQLARDLNKQIDIDISGAETELDRTVIDEIGDPLVHLIRNAVDHGIETAQERRRLGKPEQGKIKLTAYHSGKHVFIEISDDGSGIDKEKVLNKALENEVITQDQADELTDQQVYELIMASGFSTADTVSDISGRGVGLDVVKHKIESLGGNISLNATAYKGSTFSIELPLTLSILSVLLVRSGNETYAIPLSSIMETTILQKKDIIEAHSKKVIRFRDRIVPLVFLSEIFGSDSVDQDREDANISIVVIQNKEKLTGLVVDRLIGQQEIVLKSLGNYLDNTFAISGATILGDGTVALVIDSVRLCDL